MQKGRDREGLPAGQTGPFSSEKKERKIAMREKKSFSGSKDLAGRMRKLLAACLAAVMLTAAAGCGSGEGGLSDGAASQSGDAGDAAAEGTSGDQSGEDAVIAMGRYMETGIALPQGACVEGRTWAFLEDGGLAYFDPAAGLLRTDQKNVEWQMLKGSEVFGSPQEGYVTGSAVAPDGSVAFCRISYAGEEKERQVKVLYYGPEGDLLEAEGNLEENDWVDKVAFGRDSRLYAASVRGMVLEIDTQSGETKQLFRAAERPEVMAFSGKLLLALENDRVEIYDLEQRFLMDQDAVLNDFCIENLSGDLGNMTDCVGAYLIGAEEGTVYVAHKSGVYRHVLGGTVMEQIIEGDFSTFGDPSQGICSVLLTQDGEFLLLTTGEEAVRLTYDPNEPSVPQNLLTVYSLREDYGEMRQVISMFQNEHPDVSVRYEIGIPNDSAVTLTDALKNLNVELMSGKGPDVLLLDGLDASVYMEKGQLLDLTDILEGLLQENAVFGNIAGAYRKEEGTFAIPATFCVPLICGKTEDLERVTDLKTLADVAEELAAGAGGATVTDNVTPEQELRQLMLTCSPAWLSGTELNREALEEFLRQAKRIYEADLAAASPEAVELYSTHGASDDVGLSAVYMMLGLSRISYGIGDEMLGDIGAFSYFLEKEEGYSFDAWCGQAGKGFVPRYKFAVTAGSGHAELAKEFVQTAFSEKVQSRAFGNLFPVNRASFEQQCEWSEVSIGGSMMTHTGEEKRFAILHPKEEAVNRIKTLVEQLDLCLEGNSVLEEAMMKYGTEVLLGYESVEEGVENIAHAVSIYLAEQR